MKNQNMKRFKEFINEGNAMDFLKPKSDEEIGKELNEMGEKERYDYIFKYDLDDKYLNLPDNLEKYKNDTINYIKNELKEKYNWNIDTSRLKYEYIIGEDEEYYHKVYCFKYHRVEAQYIKKGARIGYSGGDFAVEWKDLDAKTIKKLEIDIKHYSSKGYRYGRGFQFESNAMDFLKPKSEEDIQKELVRLNVFDKTDVIRDYNLYINLLPTKQEIKDELKDLNIYDKIIKINKHKLKISYLNTII